MMAIYWYLQIQPSKYNSLYISNESDVEKFTRMLTQVDEIYKAIDLHKQCTTFDKNIHVDFIRDRLNDLPQKPEFMNFSYKTLTDDDRLSLFKLVIENIKTNLENKLENALQIQNSRPNEETSREYSLTRLIKLSEHITSRLKNEIEQLTKRGNLYIAIGSIITITGGFILYFTVKDFIQSYANTNDINDTINKHDILSITARVSIILFIEIFAYYYLKLYRNMMDNVKFYQNEISNMELKLLALHAIENSGNFEALKTLTDELAKTERNFVINKGQTTVDIEKSKYEQSILYKSVDSISKLIKQAK